LSIKFHKNLNERVFDFEKKRRKSILFENGRIVNDNKINLESKSKKSKIFLCHLKSLQENEKKLS
jgi:hypothetical protein